MNSTKTAKRSTPERGRIAHSDSARKNFDDADDNKAGLAVRRTAHRLLSAIIDTRTSLDAVTDDAHGHPHYLALEKRDRALLRAILMVALRYRADLIDILARYVDKPLPKGAMALHAVLHVALAQILFLDVPDHSAVDLAVESANRDPRLKRFASLVNAVCRRAVRQKETLQKTIQNVSPHSSPWYSERLVEVYGERRASQIEAMHRVEAPLDLTLKLSCDPEFWANRLNGTLLPTGSLRLSPREGDIASMEGFSKGDWWIQDAAAAIPAKLFGDLQHKRALDVCAAPGGKTAQLADAGAMVTALDMSANRLRRLEENMDRLGLGELYTAAVSNLFEFAPNQLFDAVLLDAPCSSTGTVRRHPDVPWTKTPDDITKLADLQARMLQKTAQFVAPGGTLVFSNCSLDPREGEDVANNFVDMHPEFTVLPVTDEQLPGLPGCIQTNGFVRTTPADLAFDEPGMSGMDGFFAVVFSRLT